MAASGLILGGLMRSVWGRAQRHDVLACNLQLWGPMGGAKRKILLVEDNVDVRRLYAIGLNQRGFEVKLAANGAEAVDRLATEHPDVILLDWLMPLMDGSEVVRRIDAEAGNSDIEIIVISGQPPPDTLPQRVRCWLTKPLTVEELVGEITRRTEGASLAAGVEDFPSREQHLTT